MSNLVCRKSMTRCLTPGMCAPHGGCSSTETVSSTWLAQLRGEYLTLGQQNQALIAENERLSAEEQEAADLCDRLSGLLRNTAIEVRGPEDPLKRHGFHDLPSRVKVVVAGRDQLKAFAAEMISASFEGGSFDGGDIQNIAVKHGLLRIERREDECGEGCACREYGFPAECYRKTPILDTNAENSAPLFTINENVAQDREEKNV